jgi:predicted signal transduction protein with EAL and GGDEF domain
VGELKLDRVFVSRLTQDQRTAAIVRSTVELAHNLGMRLVAEGVGDAATAEALRRYGCDLAQGYHYCRPLRGDVMFRWLTEHGGLVPALVREGAPAREDVPARESAPARAGALARAGAATWGSDGPSPAPDQRRSASQSVGRAR